MFKQCKYRKDINRCYYCTNKYIVAFNMENDDECIFETNHDAKKYCRCYEEVPE